MALVTRCDFCKKELDYGTPYNQITFGRFEPTSSWMGAEESKAFDICDDCKYIVDDFIDSRVNPDTD